MDDIPNSTAIVKQELIIDDLDLHDYEHLLLEFYSDQPEVDHAATVEEPVKAELPDLEESFQERFIVENPYAVQNEEPSVGSDGLWHCPLCPRTYKWKLSCEAHIRRHRRCEACSLLFTTPAAFDNHNLLQHGIEAPDSPPNIQAHSPAKPPQDPTVSPGKRRLSPISMQRDENGLFTCPECGKSFEKDNSYFVHVRRHKDKQKKRFYCQLCGTSFTANFSFKQHCVKYHGLVHEPSRQTIVRVELDQEPFQPVADNLPHLPPEPALDCTAPASVPEEPPVPLESDSCELLIQIFDEEVAQRDGSNPVDLEEIRQDIPCFDLVSTEDVLSSSVVVKEEVVMEQEGEQVDDDDDDGTALVDILHSRVEFINEFPTGGGFKRTAKPMHRPEYAQRCPVCKVWYHTEAGLEKHLRRHEEFGQGKSRKIKAPVKAEIPKVKVIPKTKPNFYCERCDKSYGSKHKYYLHQTRHTNIDTARFKCSQCSKALGSKQELITHERRTHESIPPKTDEENLADLLKQAKPCTILLEDILLKQESKPLKTLIKQIPLPPRRRTKKGRAKGSRKCPMCYEWFLTQEELTEHYSVHVQNDKNASTKVEEKKVDIKIKGQVKPIRPDVKQKIVPDDKKDIKLKLDSNPPERRKVGRPVGSRNLTNKLELKPKLLERRTGGRPNGSLNFMNNPQLKSEPTLSESGKVGRAPASRNSSSAQQLKSETPSSECKKRGRPFGSRELQNLKIETTEQQRGQNKEYRKSTSLLHLKSESTPQGRRKSERPTRSRSTSELDRSKLKSSESEGVADGSENDLKTDVTNPDPILNEPRKVGRPRKSQNCPTVSPTKEVPSSTESKRGRPKGSKSSPKLSASKSELKVNPLANSNSYCARCDKQFPTHKCYTLHQMRHLNEDSSRFRCEPCEKSFPSKIQLVSHEQNGHQRKAGRPKRIRSPSPAPKTSSFKKQKMDQPPINLDVKSPRKVGRPRKDQRVVQLGRPKGSKKCPLCKIWSRSADEFKEHLRSHI